MGQFGRTSFGLSEWMGAAASTPLVSIVLAAVVTGVVLALAGRRRRTRVAPAEVAVASVRARYVPERRILALAAVGVVVVFVAEHVLTGYVVNTADVVSWWRFALPVLSSFVAVAVLAATIVIRGSTASGVPVLTGARRTWTTFGSRAGLLAGGSVLVLLVLTTIAAGLVSVADSSGRYIWLEIPIPNEGAIAPIRPWFYGWAYGVPVLVALIGLITATWWVLRVNAQRPFLRPETVTAERLVRGEVANGAVSIATAGTLLALAGAWRLIASAGVGSLLVTMGQNGGRPFDAEWRYAELAAVAGWLAPVAEVVAFVLLLLVALGFRRMSTSVARDAGTDELVDAAETRR